MKILFHVALFWLTFMLVFAIGFLDHVKVEKEVIKSDWQLEERIWFYNGGVE